MRIESHSIMGTIVSLNKILLTCSFKLRCSCRLIDFRAKRFHRLPGAAPVVNGKEASHIQGRSVGFGVQDLRGISRAV